MTSPSDRGRYIQHAELRQMALALAIDSVNAREKTQDEILPTAERFLEFLTGRAAEGN